MHTSMQLRRSMFDVRLDGQPADVADVFPDWTGLDRIGVVLWEPYGAVGASHLIQLAISRFYEQRESRRGPDVIYPEAYLFHVGRACGDHNPYDFWPERKEVVVEDHPHAVLDAINDKAITRVVVPDIAPVPVEHRLKERETALDRMVSAFVYSPTGRVQKPNMSIAGLTRQTEVNPRNTLNPERLLERQPTRQDNAKEMDPAFVIRLKERMDESTPEERQRVASERDALREGGFVTETYRRISVDDALDMLVPPR